MLKPYGSLVIESYEILQELDRIAARGWDPVGAEDELVKDFVRTRLPLIAGINAQIPIRSSVDQGERIKEMIRENRSSGDLLRAFTVLLCTPRSGGILRKTRPSRIIGFGPISIPRPRN
jgi:hypothetical protein